MGDTVELNQTLCTVETNKAEVEIPSPFAGQVLELGGAAGDTLTVGSLLVRIDTSREPAAAAAATTKNGGTPRKSVLVGYGADDTMDASRRTATPGSTRARAKPPVRKLAADLHVDLRKLAPGSGPEGIVTRADVLAAAGSSDIVDVGGVQAAMARRMSLSRKEIPDAHARVEVDCSALLQLRDRITAADAALPVTPFVLTLRLLVLALGRHQMLNSTWLETAEGPQIHRHPAVHLGFGVAAPRGLLVPVVRDAQSMTTRELAGSGGPADRTGASGHAQPGRAERIDVHGVELRRARPGRRRTGDQLSGGGHSGDGLDESAAGRGRRGCGGPSHHVTDLCLRPSHRRRRDGGRVPA